MSREQARPGVQARAWWGFAAAGALSVVALFVLGRGDGGTEPPLRVLVGAAILVSVPTLGVLAVMVRSELGLPIRVVALVLGFHALILLVKLVLSPIGVYDVNEIRPLEAFVNISDPAGAVLGSLVVFLLYLGVYTLIYRRVRKRIEDLLPRVDEESRRRRRGLVLGVLVGTVLLTAAGGAGVVALPLLVVGGGLEYLGFVFGSGVSLLVAFALMGASSLAAVAFTDAAERARAVSDVGIFVGLFWVGLAFIALYHVLWVVWILVLTTTWPLRVVVPK